MISTPSSWPAFTAPAWIAFQCSWVVPMGMTAMLEGLLKELGKSLDRPRVNLLKAELDTIANKTHSPRFWAKEVA